MAEASVLPKAAVLFEFEKDSVIGCSVDTLHPAVCSRDARCPLGHGTKCRHPIPFCAVKFNVVCIVTRSTQSRFLVFIVRSFVAKVSHARTFLEFGFVGGGTVRKQQSLRVECETYAARVQELNDLVESEVVAERAFPGPPVTVLRECSDAQWAV